MPFALVVMAGVLLVAVMNNRREPWRWENRLPSTALAWPLPALVVWCVIVLALRWMVGDRYPEGTGLPPPIMFPAIAIATCLIGWFARASRDKAWAVITSSMGLTWMYFLTL